MKTPGLFLNGSDINIVQDAPKTLIAQRINSLVFEEKEDAFYICDLSDVVEKYKVWQQQLPRVTPYYAVKCNDDRMLLKLLAELGTGFDCASKSEIHRVLDLNISTDRIIYANPCKQLSHIRYAAKSDVPLMTFDNETELHKIKATYPGAKLVLRVLPPQSDKVQCPLGIKFGADPKITAHLLRVAKQLQLDVVGVSFHVGSGCYDAKVFADSVLLARQVFDEATEIGFDLDLLDIGGGFPGQATAKISFEEICQCLRPALDNCFPESCGVRIIAEPGRYFAASAFTLAVNVIAKREVNEGIKSDNDERMLMYYVNDGVYGSFNCLLYDHAEVQPTLLHPKDYVGEPQYKSSVWGPTCDGLDCISERVLLPELNVGDWLVFADMGAYTLSAASGFNGMPKPRVFYAMQECIVNQVKASGTIKDTCQFSAQPEVHIQGPVQIQTATGM